MVESMEEIYIKDCAWVFGRILSIIFDYSVNDKDIDT